MTHPASRHIFIAGATGSMGLAATRALLAAGHRVTGLARTDDSAATLRALGATPARVDIFDELALTEPTRGADAIVHFATKVPDGMGAMKPGAWRTNDRLRREGTRALLAAAQANGIRRVIFESLALAYPDSGEEWIEESTPLKPHTGFMRSVVEAEAMLNQFGEQGGEPVNLRYARIYGPGRASDGFMQLVMKRQMPIVGDGNNFQSSVHIEDVGSSVVAALRSTPGTYNVGDDEPLRQAELMQHIASTLGAPAPRQLPYPLARTLMGKLANAVTASIRISNRKLHEETGWAPAIPSAREGWPQVAHVAALEASHR